MIVGRWIAIALIVLGAFLFAWYFGFLGAVIAFPWASLLLVLLNMDQAADLLASSYKLGRGLNFWFEKAAVEKRLETTIGLTSRRVNEEGVGVLPHGVDIQWVEPMNRDAFLKEGKIVVCLDSSHNEARNIARATMMYVAEDLIRESQRFVDSSVMKSASMVVTKKMLAMENRHDSLKYLAEEFIEPEANANPEIRTLVPAMELMDEQGHLTRVLLQEFNELDAKLSPALSNRDALKETKALTRMLKVFEEREPEEHVPLRHFGGVIKINIAPVARFASDVDASIYVRRARECQVDGIDCLYILARGFNIVLAKLVAREIEKAGLYRRQQEHEFTVLAKPGGVRSYVARMVKVITQDKSEASPIPKVES